MAEFSISSLGDTLTSRISDNGDGTFTLTADKLIDANGDYYKYGSNIQSFSAMTSIDAGEVVSTRYGGMVSPVVVSSTSYATTAFGIAQNSASTEQSVLVNIFGSVCTLRNTTLTPGAVYYVDDQGALTTNENDAGGSGPGTYGIFGIALTTNEFLITKTIS